jgi:hypothetical protein
MMTTSIPRALASVIGLSLIALGGNAMARPVPVPVPEAGPRDLPGPLTGSLEISNERHRPIEVYIDGSFAIELPAQTTRVLREIPNGVRLVSYGSRQAGYQTDRVEIRIDRKAALRIAPLRGYASVRNTTMMPLRISLGDLDLGTLAPGREVLSPAMPAGAYVLTATPLGRGLRPQVQDVVIRPGETAQIDLRPFTATVIVDNPFPHGVNLLVDGNRVARLDRFGSTRLEDLMPGRVNFELRHRGERLVVETLDLVPGAELRWRPEAIRFARLEVVNPTGSRITVRVDGADEFMLRPGTSRILDQLRPGLVRVQLINQDGRTVMHEVPLRPGAVERFEVPRVWVQSTLVRPSY